jgi:predicted phage terminase large subunit-like protein
MYGGQAGGGKSDALLVGPLRYVGHPRFRAILFRNTYDDVVRSLGERSELLYPVVFPGAQYNRAEHTWTFPSGAKVYLRYLASDADALDHKSQEYQYIGFDELTTFTRHQYTYMLSRLRSSHGIPVQVRSGTNPGDRGHAWVFERFAAWLDKDHDNPAKPGEVRYYARVGDKNIEVPRGTLGARGRTFIRAALKDNPSLSADYGYQLDDLDPVTRAQLKDGDWLVKPGKGKYFKRDWVKVLSERPRDIISTVRYWDFAGTEAKSEKHDPDWTAGVKMSICSSGMILVEHCDRYRGEPADVEARTLQCAQLDGAAVRIGLEQDPGQAGKFQTRHFVRMLMGFNASALLPTGDKLQRFGPFSAQAANGNVAVMAGDWSQEWMSELEQFPEGSHDDQVDATSGAFRMLHENRNSMMDLLMKRSNQ